MSWITATFRSSIGKKYIMAATGSLLGLFLFAHLAGNSSIFWSREAFNAYAARLHSFGILISIFEILLALIFLTHIFTAVLLYIENLGARPDRYTVSRPLGCRLNSGTMPYTGLIILVFLFVHLANFHFSDRALAPSELVDEVLSRTLLAGFYLFSLTALTLHVSHGFWSMFQSVGLNHPKYNALLRIGGLVAAVLAGGIFMLIPILVLLNDTFPR